MPKVSKVGEEHFELVYPLLKKFDSTHSKEAWKNIFVQPFNNGEDNCGYSLFEGERIVGYLGYIYSSKIIDNKAVKFCNLTTWIVEEEYRNSSLLLIYPVLKLKDYCVTNYIPAEGVYNVSKKLGFIDLDLFEKILMPIINPYKLFKYRSNLITKVDEIIRLLLLFHDQNSIKIVNEHKNYKCHFILIKTEKSYCLVVFTKVKRKKMSFAYIQYISDHNMFYEHLDKVKLKLWINYKVISLIIEERNLHGNSLFFSIKKRFKFPQIVLNCTMDKSDVDNLYSELIILN
jgi:hypothetical protein